MAEKKIRVNTNNLNQTRKELQIKLDKVRKCIDKISDDMRVLNSMWEGNAHQTFEQSVTQDIQFMLEICDGIQSIINYEGNAVAEYNKCEQQVADLIEQIRI